MTFLTIQFVYRASLLSKSRQKFTKFFDGYKLILWLVYTLFISIIWGSAISILSSDDVTDAYLRNVVRVNYGVEISSIHYYPVLAYNGEGPEKTVRWNSVIFLSIVTIVMTIHYSIMMICGFYMYRRTKMNLKNSSSAYEKLQKQFFQALIYQTIAPTFVFHFPVFVVLFAPFFDLKFSFNSSFVVYGFSAYPLVDSLIVLNVVTEYKYAYARFMRQLIKQVIEVMGEDTPAEVTRTNAVISQG
ncbi:hypothetical protein CAEBREN_29722 [Caenorhabditis brenneri]|uniref:Uncharacterized protein n=1 Tax=Caenorhabditis brenneri TaxID=135651 RepID=G0PFC2_CAEBE|nr:hypothetical protein CAEBREN_29722 [Caenorhabditis brenneri]